MLKIGITGGIGSGKTTVCQIFETLGIPVYNADERAKILMTESAEIVLKIESLFGKQAYLNGVLNRHLIANIVFNDKQKLIKLEAIVHPVVQKDYENWHNQQINKAYTLKEAALLFETNSYLQLDKTILVTAPESIRIQRVIERDKTTEKAVKNRIDKQMPESEKQLLANFIINNHERMLLPQIMEIHNILSHLP